MLTKKEIAWIIIAILVLGFIIGWSEKPTYSPIVFLFSAIIILIPILTKKLAANHFNLKIEHKIWGFKQFWWTTKSHFKKPFPIGLIIPFFFAFFSLGIIKIMALLQFDAKNLKKKRVLKKRGSYRYSEINESDLAFTAAWGFWALLVLALVSSLLNQPELTKFSIYYGIWNLLPISQLDGTKLFFGSLINWIILALVYIISLVVVLV